MVVVGIVGASGYTGGELLRLLARHPEVEEVRYATSRRLEGKPVWKVHPNLRRDYPDLEFSDPDPVEIGEDCDVVFTAVPHTAAMELVPDLLEGGAVVIDLSADFRFDDVDVYEEWYGVEHAAPELNDEAVYGLPELHRDEIRRTDLIANPGCYPTGAILAAAPLVEEGLVDVVIFDSKSGTSGAGAKPSEVTHHPECAEDLTPYNPTDHRHLPEIRQELGKLGDVEVHFTPHLAPLVRGIETTAHGLGDVEIEPKELRELYVEYYDGEPFIRVCEVGEAPRLWAVRGTNYCDVGVFAVGDGRVVVASAIDNLTKGASGQAIQNMNVRFGFEETAGLEEPGYHP
ncbi:N-acetyl-gamma-glutamyl-phosphate reductase [Methanopyrus kandleri]|uniref:N-acetyl-gamma-glutamyl-phosphate reductase n=2 Tax=Methanopyrus kandleri TaxID=2320 RepID=ARGC_METKA|nr:N-acetyl-gamma-glutamyl-phosphate reductase [Methanopyrus kandleri]Q8TWF8.1 RecName: Full=N-acetyl-gamma-glutamyl-phosphate reductase; Short=AGPR; AltName: Full=N-acetyl-glutamate semialdehyde dehydrogenase; Short=NAGSA dehydrogenase [Methanopyrus kandleri AV19]AAM02290.1 Acetylglutamate semialdehyde dehydrogenase [Methanopyrus kandleri AV19]HII69709.1 N-acetyl-gamma-glutamyl-phosphate reductase [Methanopyrus kandleri]